MLRIKVAQSDGGHQVRMRLGDVDQLDENIEVFLGCVLRSMVRSFFPMQILGEIIMASTKEQRGQGKVEGTYIVPVELQQLHTTT